MKNQWSQFPFVLRRKILLTFLAGVASIAVSLVIFTVTADRILLVLGGFIFAASLVLGISLWSTTARGRYEVVEGICAFIFKKGAGLPSETTIWMPPSPPTVFLDMRRWRTHPPIMKRWKAESKHPMSKK